MASLSTIQYDPEVLTISWEMGRKPMQSIVPPLTSVLHKGSCGRVAVVGGSVEYTGAPFYSATAALKVGADLMFVLTSQEASLPIKCYGPELMVSPIYNIESLDNETEQPQLIQESIEKVKSLLPRTHSVVMGPGLGRHPAVMNIAAEVLSLCKNQKKPIVVDADGLWMVNSNLDILMNNKEGINNDHIVLTPNAAEFQRLCDAVDSHSSTQLLSSSTSQVVSKDERLNKRIKTSNEPSLDYQDLAFKIMDVSQSLGGVTILLKGKTDLISNGSCIIAVVDEAGSPRRCGGMGDILAGSVGIMLHWASSSSPVVPGEAEAGGKDFSQVSPTMWACWGGCVLTKRTAELAFSIHRRSTTAPDLLDQIGVVGENLFPTI